MYNGWTPTIPLKTRIENLYEQVTDAQFLAALGRTDGNPHDFVRHLIGEALQPAQAAYELEKFEDDWCDERLDNGLRDDAPYRPAKPSTDDDLPF